MSRTISEVELEKGMSHRWNFTYRGSSIDTFIYTIWKNLLPACFLTTGIAKLRVSCQVVIFRDNNIRLNYFSEPCTMQFGLVIYSYISMSVTWFKRYIVISTISKRLRIKSAMYSVGYGHRDHVYVSKKPRWDSFFLEIVIYRSIEFPLTAYLVTK